MAETAADFRTILDRAPRIIVKGSIVIKDFQNEMLVTKAGFGACLESEVFILKGEPFVVEVYNENAHDGYSTTKHVKMRLSNKGNKEVFVMSVKWTVSGVAGRSGPVEARPCKQAQMAAFYSQKLTSLTGGVFEAQVEVELLGDRIVTTSATPAKPSGSSGNLWVLEQLFRDLPEGSDFSLVSEEEEEVPCHLLVLSGASSYFRGKWKEFTKSRSSEVQCSTEVARNLVRFFYTGRLEDSCLDGQEETFLRLADYYQVEELKMYVEARMLQTLGKTNMVSFFIVGDTFKVKRIREAAKKFLRSNMAWLREQGDWKKAFGEKNMGLMVEVLMDLA